MEYVLTAKEAKFIDDFTINEIGIPGEILMERAALAVADIIARTYKVKDNSATKVLVVCGNGNNGGDGICIGRILDERGYRVTFSLVGNEDKATKLYRLHKEIIQKSGMNIVNNIKECEYDIVVDALFGIGLSRDIQGRYIDFVSQINKMKDEHKATIYSVDIPSGINSDNGSVMGVAVNADYTVTFGCKKRGLIFYPGADYAGTVFVRNVGFSKLAMNKFSNVAFTIGNDDVDDMLPKRLNDSNKGTYKKVLVIAGSRNMAGAAIMAGKAAMRVGAGLVKICTCESNRVIVQTALMEALLCTYEDDWVEDSKKIEKTMEMLRKELDLADTVLIGPGIGTGKGSHDIVKFVLENAKSKVVVDADGLNIISMSNDISFGNNTVITPHLKEMSRLIDIPVAQIKHNIVEVAREYAHKNNITIILKDSKTVVSDGEKVYINSSGNNGMSKGGSGDVLAGIISGLIGCLDDDFSCACVAVYLHGHAADVALEHNNCYSLTPGDIIDNLKNIM